MKKKVSEFVKKFYCVTRYDGKTKTMFITRSKIYNLKKLKELGAITITDVHREILKEFGWGLSFTLA